MQETKTPFDPDSQQTSFNAKSWIRNRFWILLLYLPQALRMLSWSIVVLLVVCWYSAHKISLWNFNVNPNTKTMTRDSIETCHGGIRADQFIFHFVPYCVIMGRQCVNVLLIWLAPRDWQTGVCRADATYNSVITIDRGNLSSSSCRGFHWST